MNCLDSVNDPVRVQTQNNILSCSGVFGSFEAWQTATECCGPSGGGKGVAKAWHSTSCGLSGPWKLLRSGSWQTARSNAVKAVAPGAAIEGSKVRKIQVAFEA